MHWDIDVQTYDFLEAKELLCRAWDEDMNTQPAVITWNLMGMMNNCYHRIKIHPHRCQDGSLGLRFQHPAPVELGERGSMGWREEDNIRQQAIAAVTTSGGVAPAAVVAQSTPARSEGDKVFTMEEVAKHNTEESAWFVHAGSVYDATRFLEEHPGGAESILIVAGMDATEDFDAIHSKKAKDMLKEYYIGRLAAPGEQVKAAASVAVASGNGVAHANGNGVAHVSNELVALNPREKVSLKLAEKIEVSHNTRIFRFALPSPQHRLGLPCGKHVFMYANIDGENVMRAYTPISSDDDLGHLDLLIKVYFAGTNPNHPPGGKMSQHLERLSIGDCISFKGPIGHFVYEGRGAYLMHKHRGVAKHLSMVAGGTGITPVYAVMQAVLKDTEVRTGETQGARGGDHGRSGDSRAGWSIIAG